MLIVISISIILILAGAGYPLYRLEDYDIQRKGMKASPEEDALNTKRKKWRNVWGGMLIVGALITGFMYALFGYKVVFLFSAGLIFHYLIFESLLHYKLFGNIFDTGKTHTKKEFPKTKKQAIILKSALLLIAVAAIIIATL